MAMSPEHKVALVQGRKEAKSIKSYLEALAARHPGRPVTKDNLKKRLGSISERLAMETDALKRVDLHQTKIEIEAAIANAQESVDLTHVEDEFAKVAKAYSDRKGISYAAWRGAGVSAAALKKAGIARTRRG
jgi:hypothetical protein